VTDVVVPGVEPTVGPRGLHALAAILLNATSAGPDQPGAANIHTAEQTRSATPTP
jgi:hypothetical protein